MRTQYLPAHHKATASYLAPANYRFFSISCQAKECLKVALECRRHEISYVMLGKIHLMEGDMNGAIEIYRSAVE